MKLILALVAIAALSGCANLFGSLDTHQYAVKRTIVLHEPFPGKFVATERDTAWEFGPTRLQRHRFNTKTPFESPTK